MKKNLLAWATLAFVPSAAAWSQPNTTVQKHQFFDTQLSSQSNSHIYTWPLEKPEPWLDRPFLARYPHRWCYILISWLQSPSAVILEPPKIKSDPVSTVSPPISHEVVGPDAMILIFWMLSFKPTFSLSTFTLIKRLLSSSSLSAIRVVSSAYLRLLIFLLAILIPACASSSLIFHLMLCIT